MKLQDSIDFLKKEKEKKVCSRFPCRVFLLHSLKDYQNAVSHIKLLCDRAVSSEELFLSDDVMPAYDRLIEKIKRDEWVWIPGVSEYLRLFGGSEQRKGRLYSLWHSIVDASSTGRIIIPLWNCDSLWNDDSFGFKTDERQRDFVYYVSEDELVSEQVNITVFSDSFDKYINKFNGKYFLINGLREWYEQMLSETSLPTDYCLITRQVQSVSLVTGVDTIKNEFDFVRNNLQDGSSLREEECSEELLGELFDESLNNNSVCDAILHRFNMVKFDGVSVMSKWKSYTKGKRQLLKLWYRLNPDNSYLCHCFEKYDPEDIEKHIIYDILDAMQFHTEWIAEYQQLIQVLNIKKNNTYFKKLNSLPTYEDRLKFLTDDTKAERICILRMVGDWLKKDGAKELTYKTQKTQYHLLQAYFSPMPAELGAVYNEFCTDYKVCKLSDTLPESDEVFFRGIEPKSLPSRYSQIKKQLTDDTVILWIDGMGFEYMSLLLDRLSENKKGDVVFCALAEASLPTETKFNDHWRQMEDVPYEKLDKLDKLAHKGVVDEPDYYACIEEQLAFFDNISDKVGELLETYQRVIITGDHGTSRLAARFFHLRDGLQVFKDAKPCSHGRYCEIKSDPDMPYDNMEAVKDSLGQRYLVFKSYDHFSVSGRAAGNDEDNVTYGEVHGGASPEEMIVPVVVFDRKSALPLEVKWLDDKSQVKLKRKSARAVLEFNRKIKKLEIKAGSLSAVVSDNKDGKSWSVLFENIKPGEYDLVIVADGKLVSVDKPLKVLSALGSEGDI